MILNKAKKRRTRGKKTVLSTKTTNSYNSSVNSKLCPHLEQFIFHSIFIHIIKTILQNNRTPAMHQAALTREIPMERAFVLVLQYSTRLFIYFSIWQGRRIIKRKLKKTKSPFPHQQADWEVLGRIDWPSHAWVTLPFTWLPPAPSNICRIYTHEPKLYRGNMGGQQLVSKHRLIGRPCLHSGKNGYQEWQWRGKEQPKGRWYEVRVGALSQWPSVPSLFP